MTPTPHPGAVPGLAAAPSLSTVGYSNLGGAGQQRPPDVDQLVMHALGMPMAGLTPMLPSPVIMEEPAGRRGEPIQGLAEGGEVGKPQYFVPPRGKGNFPQVRTPDYPGRYAGLGREMMRLQRDYSQMPDIRVDRERMRQWLADQPLSTNIEDRRGHDPTMDESLGPTMGYATGGLAKPVLSSSSMNSMGQQSHFGARNVQSATPKGSNISAINVPAVRSPGAHLINSSVAGRTDRIPMRARTGSFVIPADVVSGLGEGNTMAGAKMWGQLLTHSVTGGATGGMRRASPPPIRGGIARTNITGPGSRVPPPPRPIIAPPQKVPFQNLPVSSRGAPRGFQDGGFMGHNGGPEMMEEDDDTTPIITAGGEMIVDPEIVTAMGGGDPEEGTRILCKSVDEIRKQVNEARKKLPSPQT